MKTAYCHIETWEEIKAKILFELQDDRVKIYCTNSSGKVRVKANELAALHYPQDTSHHLFIEEVLLQFSDENDQLLYIYPSQIQFEKQWEALTSFLKKIATELNCEFCFYQVDSESPVAKLSDSNVVYDPDQLPQYISKIVVINEHFKKEVFQACLSQETLLEFEKKLYSNKVLQYQMDNSFVLSLCEFRYKQENAIREFKKLIFQRADADEFRFFEAKYLCNQILEEPNITQLHIIAKKLYDYGCPSSGTIDDFANAISLIIDMEANAFDQETRIKLKEKTEELLNKLEEYEFEMEIILDETTLESFEDYYGVSHQYNNNISFATRASVDKDWFSILLSKLGIALLIIFFSFRQCHQQKQVKKFHLSPEMEKSLKIKLDSIQKAHKTSFHKE